jgi:hypothetical protein
MYELIYKKCMNTPEHMVKLQVLGNNSKTVNNIKNLTWGKNDQHIKIYPPCNFEVNLITHFGVI